MSVEEDESSIDGASKPNVKMDSEGFPTTYQIGAQGESESKTPVRRNSKKNTNHSDPSQKAESKKKVDKNEEKKDDESENSLDAFLESENCPSADSKLGEDQPSAPGQGNGSSPPLEVDQVSVEKKLENVNSKKKAARKLAKKKKKRTVMKTGDEDSIRSEGSGYSLPSGSGTEGEQVQKRPKQGTEASLDRVLSMESRSDSDGSTGASFSDDGGSTDGDGSYESGESQDSGSVYSRDKDFDDESTTENPISTSEQRTKEKKLLQNVADLKEIELGDHSLIRHSPADLAAAIRNNCFLQKIILNQRNCDPVSFEILLEGLDQNTSILQLELHRVVITKEMAIELTSALSKNTTLKKFCIRKCKLVESGLAVLFMGLQHNRSIRHLGIETCNLAGHRSNIIAAAVPLMRLQSIRLQNTNVPDKHMRFFLHNIGKTPSLESINLSEESLSEPSLEKLVQSIQKCPNLVRLVLSDCGLDESGIETLAEGLEKSEKLESLNVSKNRFGDEGAEFLIDLVKCNNAIKNLKYDGCRIGRHEKRLLKDALRYNNTFLKSLFSPEVTLSILDSVGLFDKKSSK
eukprot:scaffold517_cov119-Cylindrotheca_fusiformis.AAC.1